MDRDILMYFEDALQQDVFALTSVSTPSAEIPDAEYKRAINSKLESIGVDLSNIQHLLES